MGASGTLIICEHGHTCLSIEEHMAFDWWQEVGFALEEKARKANCPTCGTSIKYQFQHYGDPNDCLDGFGEHPLNLVNGIWTIGNLIPIDRERARVNSNG